MAIVKTFKIVNGYGEYYWLNHNQTIYSLLQSCHGLALKYDEIKKNVASSSSTVWQKSNEATRGGEAARCVITLLKSYYFD